MSFQQPTSQQQQEQGSTFQPSQQLQQAAGGITTVSGTEGIHDAMKPTGNTYTGQSPQMGTQNTTLHAGMSNTADLGMPDKKVSAPGDTNADLFSSEKKTPTTTTQYGTATTHGDFTGNAAAPAAVGTIRDATQALQTERHPDTTAGGFDQQGERLLQHEKLTGAGYQQTDLQGSGYTAGTTQNQAQPIGSGTQLRGSMNTTSGTTPTETQYTAAQPTTGETATHAQTGTVCSPSQPITQQSGQTNFYESNTNTTTTTPQQPLTGIQTDTAREQSSYQQQQQGGTFEQQGERLMKHEKLTGSGYQQTDLKGEGYTAGIPEYQTQQTGTTQQPQQAATTTAFGGYSNTTQRTPTDQTQLQQQQPLGFTESSGFGGTDANKKLATDTAPTTGLQKQQQQDTPQQQTFGQEPTTAFGETRNTTAATGFVGGVAAFGSNQQQQHEQPLDNAHVEAGETGTHAATGTRHTDSQPLKEVHPQQQQLDEVKGLGGFDTTNTTKQHTPTPTHNDTTPTQQRAVDRGAPAPNTKAAAEAAVADIVPQPGHRTVDIHDEPKDIQKFLKKEDKIETKEVKDRDHVEHKAEKKLEKILEKEEKHREKIEKKDEKSDTHVTHMPAAGVQDITKDKPSSIETTTTKPTQQLHESPQTTTTTTASTMQTQPLHQQQDQTQFEKAAGGITSLSGVAAMKEATHIQDETAGQQQTQQYGGQQTTGFGTGGQQQQTQFQQAAGGITTMSGISAIRDATHIQQEQGQPQFDTARQTTPQDLTAGEQMQREQQKIHNAQPAPNEPTTQLQQASQKSLQHETTLPREGITPAKDITLTQDQPVSFTPGFSSAGGMGGAVGQRPLQFELTAGIEGGERQQPQTDLQRQHDAHSAFNDQKVEGFEVAPEHFPVERTAGVAWFADTTKSAAELSKEAPEIHSPSSIPVAAANPVLRDAPTLPPATETEQPTMTQRDIDKVSTTSTAGGTDSGKFVHSDLTGFSTTQQQEQQAQRG